MINRYSLTLGSRVIAFSPKELSFEIRLKDTVWRWGAAPSITLSDGDVLLFSEARCEAAPRRTGVSDGVAAQYCAFRGKSGKAYEIKAYTFTWVNASTGELNFDIRVEGDKEGQIKALSYPAAFEFDAKPGEGYTVLPRMQGTLVPAGTEIRIADGRIQERDGYLSFFGQVKNGSGYLAIYDTPYDAHYGFSGGVVTPYFIPSLGKISYKRRMTYLFYDGCDYVTFAKAYRSYIKYKGRLVTLEEKIANNPAVARLIGTPIVHEGIAVHISEKSDYYTPGEPDKNEYYTSFAELASQLRALKARGVEKAYLHLDGWGRRGYDNLHPDVFPPHEKAGGADGMRELSDTCRGLGYVFGIHDQYRDYYYDADSFDMANAVENLDGSNPYCSVWYGGPHSYLCASLAPYYVRRNYGQFERLGIKIEGAYLDVFSVAGLDECCSRDHPMTREQCAAARRLCFDILTAKGIIPSSEETIDSIVPSLALCHHAPYFTSGLGSPDAEPVGVPIPLFNLVYHDCIVIPWFGAKGKKGGWGIPGRDSGYLHALLNGGTIYCSILADREEIEFGRPALELHRRVAKRELVSHGFIGGNVRRQRSVFDDGTEVEVDFDGGFWKIRADGFASEGSP